MKHLRKTVRARAAGIWIAIGVLLAPTLAPAQLPTLGDTGDMSTAAERKMGEKIARELYRDPDYIDDPVLDEYVLDIWKKLLAAARVRGELSPEMDERFAWQVLLGKDRTINAFALPGGWLGLHLGLINVTTSPDELASVLAHELSHVTQRHIARLIAQQNKTTPMLVAAMILGALAASKNPEAANAVIVSGQALAIQNQLNFSRDMEREADRVGFGVMTQAGFEPQGFVSMFEKLQQASRLTDSGSFPYLRTHPLNTERIAEMQSRQQLAARTPAGAMDLAHSLIVARARVLSNPGVDVLRSYVGEPDAGTMAGAPLARQAGSLYSAALAASKLRDAPAATGFARRLATLVAGNERAARIARLLSAEIAFQAGEPARAAQMLEGAGSTRPEVMLLSQARIQGGRAGDATQQLQTWVATHPRDAPAWQLLAGAYAAQGQTLRSVRAEAESRVAQLDYQAAMDRFRAAQDMARKGTTAADHIEASIIDTRTRQVESLLREQALER